MKPFRSRALYFLLFGYMAISLTYQLVASVSLIVGYFDLRRQVQEPFDIDFETPVVKMVTDRAKRAGLRVGDTVESLNGTPYYGRELWQKIRWYAHVGNVIRIGVRRADGTTATVAVPLEGYPRGASANLALNNIHVGEAIFVVFLQIVVPLFCLGLGYWVALARPADLNAWFILILLSYPEAYISVSTYNWWPGSWLELRLFWHVALQLLAPAALLLLGLLFPERSRIDVRFPWLKWLILAVLGSGLGVGLATDYSSWYDLRLMPGRARVDAISDKILTWAMVACIVIYFVAIFDKLRTASSRDARRRMGVLCAGSAVGLGSILIVWGVLPWLGVADPGSIQWLGYVGAILMLAFPLSLAYVVIVQRAMDVSLVIRQGLQYTLAKRGVFIVQILLSAALFIFVAIHTRSQAWTPVGTILLCGAGLWGIFLLHGAAQRIGTRLDRQFFRDTYDAEQILSDLAEKVRTIVETPALLATVSQRVSEALHVPKVAVLLASSPYQPAWALGYGKSPSVTFPEHAATVQMLKSEKRPVRIYFDDPEGWIYRDPAMSDNERQNLAELRSELLLPLLAKDNLIGFVSLGQKLSEAPYSGADLRLLNSVAAQTSMALEVSRLTNAVALQRAQRERLDRELEIAREVQERLFPQVIPIVRGVTLSGGCRPAYGVGGDYYDMIELKDGRLGLAIADVSGKGISAALLMASLRACLRTLTLVGAPVGRMDLSKLTEQMNQLVYESSAITRYATVFFAIYDPTSRRLEYVNAGHNPPFLVRSSRTGADKHVRLEAGGTVIGLLPNMRYEEQSVIMEPGDLLLAYIDGISEAMTEKEEEWGEERMLQATEGVSRDSADDVLQRVFTAADEFTGKAPQHDDMTLLVLKVEDHNEPRE